MVRLVGGTTFRTVFKFLSLLQVAHTIAEKAPYYVDWVRYGRGGKEDVVGICQVDGEFCSVYRGFGGNMNTTGSIWSSECEWQVTAYFMTHLERSPTGNWKAEVELETWGPISSGPQWCGDRLTISKFSVPLVVVNGRATGQASSHSFWDCSWKLEVALDASGPYPFVTYKAEIDRSMSPTYASTPLSVDGTLHP